MTLKSTTTNQLPPFLAMSMMQLTQTMEAAGHDVLHLEVGQPSTPAPAAVSKALTRSLPTISAHGYSVAFGQTALRQRIAAHYEDWYGARPDWQNIAVTPGSSMGFVIAFLSAFDRGDKIAITTPGYPAYRNIMISLGLEPVSLPARAAQNWIADLDALAASGDLPGGLLLASPANPTGVVMSDAEIKAVCAWCDKHQVRLIMDEIYHGLSFRGPSTSAFVHNKDAIIINSFSKYFCMTGWRLGWMILPDDLRETAERLAQNLYISATTLNQHGAVAAFDCYDELNGHIERYQENRDILLRNLPPEFLGNAAPSDGAFYLYADISAFTSDSIAFANRLLEDTGVACTAGVDFDPEEGHKFLRLSYAGSTDNIRNACQRINDWLPRLAKSA